MLNTVSPLHEAVLQAQRRQDEYNRVYSEAFALRESRRPWSRAFVVAQYLRSSEAPATGFELVSNFEDLRSGDIGAYAMGRYAKPSDDSRPKPRDTGHVFIVAGRPSLVDPDTKNYDGRGTLVADAAKGHRGTGRRLERDSSFRPRFAEERRRSLHLAEGPSALPSQARRCWHRHDLVRLEQRGARSPAAPRPPAKVSPGIGASRSPERAHCSR